MKRALALVLTMALLLSLISGCATKSNDTTETPVDSLGITNTTVVENDTQNEKNTTETESNPENAESAGQDSNDGSSTPTEPNEFDWEEEIKFTGMADENLPA